MARPGVTRWRTKNTSADGSVGGDEVQRSLELLDRVLSEFDDLENGNVANALEGGGGVGGNGGRGSLGGQLSEDDGYMSMNGRRSKFALQFRPLDDAGQQLPPTPEPPTGPPPPDIADYPPPPEEAERVISTLLPRVSSGNSAKRAIGGWRAGKHPVGSLTLGPHYGDHESRVTTATQTTLPKTRHQRPFGWENGVSAAEPLRFNSLPYDSSWLPRPPAPDDPPARGLRPLAEVTDDDHAAFSDDSLEELLPPPPPVNKRSSIAWEVPLDLDDEALLTPGSTKVVGRRRRRSTDRSSTGSIPRLRDQEDWPDPPTGTEDGSLSPLSDWDSSASKLDEGSFLPPELSASDLSASGTYVIRKGRRKERAPVPKESPERSRSAKNNSGAELKRCSSTFDNIKSLLKDGLVDGLDETPPDFQPPSPPGLVRVVSLPSLNTDQDEPVKTELLRIQESEERIVPEVETVQSVQSKSHDVGTEKTPEADCKQVKVEKKSCAVETEMGADCKPVEAERKCDVGIQVMDDLPILNKQSVEESTQVSLEYREINDRLSELSKSCDSMDSKTEEAALIRKLQQDQTEDFSSSAEDILSPTFGLARSHSAAAVVVAKQLVEEDPWLRATEISQVQVVPVVEETVISEDKAPGDFKVMVEVLQHEFGPLPPSPVEEDDEYSEVLRNSPVKATRGKADSVPEPFYRCLEPPGSDPIGAKFLNRPCPDPPTMHREPTSSLKTRSMDAGFSRNHRNQHSNSRRDIPSERRTLPSELPGPSRRRPFNKRGSSQSPREEGHMQVSCSLPETPIFARGCDIPRTPHRRAPDVPLAPPGTRTAPRPSGLQTGSYRRTTTLGSGHATTSSSVTLGQAMVGAELLRLTGGPGRGWYPRQRQPRPASVENLDHLATGTHSHSSHPAYAGGPRKPLTLPPNLTPKFFHRSPREALRRVTSLLIRKDEPVAAAAPPLPSRNASLQPLPKGNGKDSKKDQMSPTQAFSPQVEEGAKQKRGFFKSFWKRSRHYSLEQQ